MKKQSDNMGYFPFYRSAVLPAAMLVGALALTGCEGTNETTSTLDEGGEVNTASATLSVAFPSTSTGEASKALVSSDALWVGFRYCRVPSGEQWCYYEEGAVGTGKVQVDRDNPTATIQVPPGNYIFEAAAFPTQEEVDEIDYAMTGGELIEGENTIRMTFLRGDWTFQDDSGAAAPITLGDGTVVDGFKLLPWSEYDQMTAQAAAAAAGKASLNPSLPVGWQEYGSVIKTSTGENDAGWTSVITQFHSGGTNSSSVMGIDYNVTQGLPFEYAEDSEQIGDRSIFMLGAAMEYEDTFEGDYGPFGLLPGDTLTDGSGDAVDMTAYNSEPLDGVTLKVDLAEFVIQSVTEELVFAGGAAAAKASAADLRAKSSLKDVILAATATATASEGVVSKSSTTEIGTLRDTWYDPAIVASGDGTNRGTWNFDDWVYNAETGTYDLVEDGCLVTDANPVYATCGYLESVYDTVTATSEMDAGEFSWGLEPSDPNNLGDYDPDCWATQEAGIYDPWCFYSETGEIDYGSFSFSHYLAVTSEMSDVRVHHLQAGGAQLPLADTGVTLQ